MSAEPAGIEDFLSLSAALSGFSVFRLRGTGQATAYLSAVSDVVGGETLSELLSRFRAVREEAAGSEEAFQRLLRVRVLSDEKLGPIARNVIKLWYVGTWYELPRAWCDAFGARERDVTFVVSPAAYTEGLLWPAIGANPPGAKGPGYGTWADPPRISDAASLVQRSSR